MPTTVNGIGTHYYGKKNSSTRTAPCKSCHRVAILESYDTRLWFVFFFIPVIPLGRKRIIDCCCYCSRHFVAKANQFEQSRQLQTSAGLERYRREQSPEAALAAHAQFLMFHEYEQAKEFRDTVLERFPENGVLQAGLASQLFQMSSHDEANKLYDLAFKLRPDLPEARIGVARRLMWTGQLDQARELLDFLEVPGAGEHYSLAPLDQLSGFLQAKGRHEETLSITAHLLQEIPEAGQQHQFRRFVRKSERALKSKETILPPLAHSFRGLFQKETSPYPAWVRRTLACAAVLALLAVGLLMSNEYIRTHRTIHVVNATGKPVSVEIDSGPPQSVGNLGQLAISEGRHQVRLSGAVSKTHEVELNSGFFDRWSYKPVWILNPGGEAVLEVSTIYYAQVPEAPQHTLLVGQAFMSFPHADYVFEPPPREMRLSHKSQQVKKICVQRLEGEDLGAFLSEFRVSKNRAADFAEQRLRRQPNQDELLRYYVAVMMTEDRDRALAFLKTNLEHRPVLLHWHRAYQSLMESKGKNDEIVALYDGYLKSEPTSGSLLYLRGRVDPDWDRQEKFYRSAIDADPKLAWPWMALGARAAALAQWDEALRCLRKAQDLKIDPAQINDLLHAARLARGEAQALVTEDQARLRINANDLEALVFLFDDLAASGQAEKISSALAAWENQIPAAQRAQTSMPARALALYQAGNAAECERHCEQNSMLRSGGIQAQALMALGRSKEVVADALFEKGFNEPWGALAVSLGLSLDGLPDEAKRWQGRACEALDSRFRSEHLVAKILRASQPSPLEDVMRLVISPDEKSLLLSILSVKFPEKRSDYLAAAERFHLLRKPPYLLVQRVLQGKSAVKP